MKLLAAMVCLGVLTLMAQLLFARELLVLCTGNELTIGVVIGVWLALIGVGAVLGRRVADKAGPLWWRGWGVAVFVWLACVVPAALVLLRVTGGGVTVAGSGTVTLARVFGLALLSLAPVCLPAGLLFPVACSIAAKSACGDTGYYKGGGRAIALMYAWEAAGSCLGGAVCTFVLMGRLEALQVAVLAMAVGLLAAALVAEGMWRSGLLVVFLLTMGMALTPGALTKAEWGTSVLRWEKVGVLSGGRGAGDRLAASGETRYQNLALIESAGQYTLYGDGQVAYSFPDQIAYEHDVHLVMAQKPEARRVLVIGGNPVGELPVLLRYPLQRLVRVALDPGADAMVRQAVPALYGDLETDQRLEMRHEDGMRYIKTCRESFDVILILTAEPVTGGLNRYYTREFYAQLAGRLAPGGFVYTALEGSERMERDAVRVVASVYRALRAVFPEVRVMAGTPCRLLAAGGAGVLTMDAGELRRRWTSAGIQARYFRPEYFLTTDALVPERLMEVEVRLAAAPGEINSMERPVSYFQTLVLWSRYSGSGLERVMRGIEGIHAGGISAVILLMGVVGGLMGRRARRAGRLVAGVAMTVAGFCGVALEMVLLYIFQGLHGYVYGHMGFLVGLFMLGAVTGALAGKAGGAAVTVGRERWRLTVGLVAMALLAGVTGWIGGSWHCPDGLIFALVTAVGFVMGFVFVSVARWLGVEGVSEGGAAAVTDAADYAGSSLGGVAAGVFLIPLLGLERTSVVLMAMLGACLLLVVMQRKRKERNA